MSKNIKLTGISKGKAYQIAGFTDEPSPNTKTKNTEYAEKLHKMGFVEGTPIQLAPVKLSDPLIFEIRGSRIALRKKEAQHILVQEF